MLAFSDGFVGSFHPAGLVLAFGVFEMWRVKRIRTPRSVRT
jgi:hypothetical protein